jgi:hypothetical protein
MYVFQHGIIASSNGGGAYSYLLDTYGSANFAFSIFKLSSSYVGNCLRVRRSSDNAEFDVSFSGNYIDIDSMTSFVGVANGFIVKWYDQSGNNNDSLQTSASLQPIIISSGVLVVSSVNGRPMIYQNGTNTKTLNLTSNVAFGNPFVQSAVIDRFDTSKYYITTGGLSSVTTGGAIVNINTGRIQNWVSSTNYTLTDTTVGEKVLTTYRKSNLMGGLLLNNIQQDVEKLTSKATSTSLTRILNLDNAQGFSNLQELIFWSTDYISNINDINNNINSRYEIY